MDLTDIEDIFSYHPPKDEETRHAHEKVRENLLDIAIFFYAVLPDSTEKTLAIRKLQEAMMYANAAIAIHGV